LVVILEFWNGVCRSFCFQGIGASWKGRGLSSFGGVWGATKGVHLWRGSKLQQGLGESGGRLSVARNQAFLDKVYDSEISLLE